MEENNIFNRLHNLDVNNSEITDLFLSDEYIQKNYDYLLENKLIGNNRRYLNELQEAVSNNQ